MPQSTVERDELREVLESILKPGGEWYQSLFAPATILPIDLVWYLQGGVRENKYRCRLKIIEISVLCILCPMIIPDVSPLTACINNGSKE